MRNLAARTLVVALATASTVAGLASPAVAEETVTIEGFTYDPPILEVAARDTVTWVNNDPEPHTATAEDGTFDSGEMPPGASFSHTFADDAAIPYFCQIHPDMQAQVVVGDAEPFVPVLPPPG